MAKIIEVLDSLEGQQNLPVFINSLKVKSGTAASIKRGYLVIKDGGNAGYAKAAADACDNTAVILGIAVGDSTETATADGVVQVITASVLLVRMFAKVPGNLATSKLLSAYTLDVSTGSYTFDESVTTNGIFRLVSYDDATNGLCICTLACNW